jgi:hypothetical protein
MRKLLWLVVALWPLLCAQTFAGRPYSAETVVKAQGQAEVVSRTFVGGKDRWRVEVAGQPQATIVRLDRKLMYTLMPASKSYFEMAMSEEEASPAYKGQQPEGKVSRRLLGKEAVGGRPARKYEVTLTRPGQKPQVTYEWLSEELGIPLRMEAADKSWSMECRNVKVGPQDARLFEVPAGYTRLTMPSLPQMPRRGR